MGVTKPGKAVGGRIERFVPACFAEMAERTRRIDVEAFRRRVDASDQRFGQAVRMGDVIEPEPAFDAQPLLVGRAVDAVDPGDRTVFDL